MRIVCFMERAPRVAPMTRPEYGDSRIWSRLAPDIAQAPATSGAHSRRWPASHCDYYRRKASICQTFRFFAARFDSGVGY